MSHISASDWFESQRDQGAFQPTTDLPGPHPGEDAHVLHAWTRDQLTDEAHAQLMTHLTQCARCHSAAKQAFELGVVSFEPTDPEADIPPHIFGESATEVPGNEVGAAALDRPTNRHTDTDYDREPGNARPLARNSRARTRWIYALVATSAALLFVIFVWPSDPLATARRALESGDYSRAVAVLLEQTTDDNQDSQARDLLRNASEALSRQQLGQAEFAQVLQLQEQLQRRRIDSDGLRHLMLRAKEQQSSEHWLAEAGQLQALGYQVDGGAKGGSPYEQIARFESDYQALLAANRDNVSALLNLGFIRLVQLRPNEGLQLFRRASESESHLRLATLGMGLAKFVLAEDLPNRRQSHYQPFVEWLSKTNAQLAENLDVDAFVLQELSPARARAYQQFQMSLYESSQADFEKLIAADPNDAAARANLEVLRRRIQHLR